MQIDRKKLLEAIDIIKPAIATKDMIEALVHIWFTGSTILAYNDASLGIEVPFKTDLKGGVKADILVGVLSNSNAETIEINVKGDDPDITVGKAKLKITLLPADRQPWHFPKMNTKPSTMTFALINGLKDVRLSIGPGATTPEQLGVTLKTEKTQLHLYTVDGPTCTYKTVERPKPWQDITSVILPTLFVEQIVRLADEGTEIVIGTDQVVATTTKGVRIFARLIDQPDPIDFDKMLVDHLKGTEVVPVPGRLRLALERATIIAESQTDKDKIVECLVKDSRLKLYCEGPYGVLRDSMDISKNLRERNFGINPRLLKRGLDLSEKIKFGDRSVILEGDHFMYLCCHRELPKN